MAPISAYAERALIVTFPPVPLLRERVTLRFMYGPGGQNQDLFPSYSRPTGAFFHQNLITFLLMYTASCIPTCSVQWW